MVTLAPLDIQPGLAGEKVSLRPLEESDFDALYAVASDPEIWVMHPYPDRYQRDVFEGFFAEAIASNGAFAIFDRASHAMIGSSRFANHDALAQEIEIGWTFFARSHWRGGFNRETKALMLRHIFPVVKTVVFQIGAHNLRSRTAVERLGGRFVRSYARDHQGQSRDYVMYHLTAEDARAGALGLEGL